MNKIKDLPPETNMGGITVKTPTGIIGKWVSQWNKGVWLSCNPSDPGKVTPIFVEDLTEILEWEVINK